MKKLLIALCSLWIGGCALSATSPPSQTGVAAAAAELPDQANAMGWRYIMLQHRWDPEHDPEWSMDLLLAAELLGPSLDRHREQVRFWRFHRRAGRGSAGHQLTLLLYTDASTANQIYLEVVNHPWSNQLLAEDLVRMHHRGISNNSRPDIADSSDPNWSPELASAWPHYIMGISEFWLSLIRDYRSQQALPANLDQARQRYQEINEQLTDTWQSEGHHALLHHLSASFAYQPLLIRY
ncbi:hypothetical protein MIB92_12470 [Aestuariirhabdus sp. Z084]|uniref:hypothetical protein n=1 Tax=Aestuariirhabdus haliotis TaxID=2918751 RepID=UPI00201B460F|nr:hypothetical protein [Aestuariirhabdus haliotis]MCL6416469.1 hypothetical protein [Aestuariirhabdus haliotis]MCL6420459.1 hypothetical protein [Aestuariirhabdus haliotis]